MLRTFLADSLNSFSPDQDIVPLTQPPHSDLGAAFIKMLLVFVLLIVLLFGTYWLLKKLIQHRLQKGSQNCSIHILEKRMLSAKTMLYLIEVEEKKILIAESQLELKKLESLES